MRLGRAEPAVRTGDRAIGESNFTDVACIRACIKISEPMTKAGGNAVARRIGPGVERAGGIDGGNRAVALEPHANPRRRRVAPFAVTQFFLARVTHAHGLAGFVCEQRSDRSQARLVFAAEAPAQVCSDHAHLIMRQSENTGELVAVAVNIAAGFPNRESVTLPPRQAVAWLQCKRAGGLRPVGLLDDELCFLHAVVDIAAEKFNRYFASEIGPAANGRRIGL